MGTSRGSLRGYVAQGVCGAGGVVVRGEADNEDESDEDEGDKVVREMEKKVKNK